MLKKIIWLTAMLSLILHASSERNFNGVKEYIRCFDGQVSFIEKKNHFFYSALNNKFSNKDNASKDSCKKQYIISKKNTLVCSKKQYVIKTIEKKKKVLYPGCFRLKKELNLVVSAHTYHYMQLPFYHIKYQGKDLFIPKSFISLRTKETLQQTKKYHKKYHKISKYKIQKKYTHLDKKTKKYHKISKYKAQKKHPYNRIKETIRKKEKKSNYSHTNRKDMQANYQNQKATKINKSYTYKCIGSHGGNNIFATDDTSISMASDILWRMCQKLKTVDEVCKIRDCYKLIR